MLLLVPLPSVLPRTFRPYRTVYVGGHGIFYQYSVPDGTTVNGLLLGRDFSAPRAHSSRAPVEMTTQLKIEN
ncbi:MAG: hypothetical protein LBG31_00805 [Prevotellaceae bacterium]|nr:hypothetical protein [Prevotellaceae bacterium]